mgnify:CR=1 FL=1
MKLETKKQTIELVFRTKKIVDITRKAGCKNFEEVYFKAMKDYDIVALSQIIYTIAENQVLILFLTCHQLLFLTYQHSMFL